LFSFKKNCNGIRFILYFAFHVTELLLEHSCYF